MRQVRGLWRLCSPQRRDREQNDPGHCYFIHRANSHNTGTQRSTPRPVLLTVDTAAPPSTVPARPVPLALRGYSPPTSPTFPTAVRGHLSAAYADTSGTPTPFSQPTVRTWTPRSQKPTSPCTWSTDLRPFILADLPMRAPMCDVTRHHPRMPGQTARAEQTPQVEVGTGLPTDAGGRARGPQLQPPR